MGLAALLLVATPSFAPAERGALPTGAAERTAGFRRAGASPPLALAPRKATVEAILSAISDDSAGSRAVRLPWALSPAVGRMPPPRARRVALARAADGSLAPRTRCFDPARQRGPPARASLARS